MERLIFDTHTHYTAHAFDKDRQALLEALPLEGVALVVDCATDLETARESLALAQQTPYMHVAAGIHPQSLIEEDASTQTQFNGDWRAEMQAIAPLYENERVVAVGEVGLDHHWPVPREEQLLLFEASIQMAMERDLPLIIHDREAHGEMYELLRRYKPKGVLHAYSGSAEDVKWLCGQGLYIGLGGGTTFKNAHKRREAAAAVPDEYLLLETDCPYMAPEPHRGQRCDSRMVLDIAQVIARERATQPEALLRLTLENGKRLFGLA